jgi:hypothetical protein
MGEEDGVEAEGLVLGEMLGVTMSVPAALNMKLREYQVGILPRWFYVADDLHEACTHYDLRHRRDNAIAGGPVPFRADQVISAAIQLLSLSTHVTTTSDGC